MTGLAVRGPAPLVRAEDFSPALKTRLLVLQPTPFCNIDCSYCYLPDRQSRARMSMATLRRAAQHLVDDGLLGPELTLVWHAGEPLVLPPAYYDEAFALLHDVLAPHTQVSHSMQSNATLINDDWCRFFSHHRVAIGVSVDGPAELHDRHRRKRARTGNNASKNQGTHAQVQRGIDCLRAHGLPFHAIAVVTAHTLADPGAFFDYFEAQGIRELGCNFDEAEGANAHSSLLGLEDQHQAFMELALQRTAAGRLQVREIVQAGQLLAQALTTWSWRGQHSPLNTQVMPLALVTVNADGGFSTFSPELAGQPWPAYGNFVFGNVHSSGYLQALASPAFGHLWAELMTGLRACENTCAHFAYCGGGAPANKLYEHGHLMGHETLHCRSMLKRPFDAVLRHAEKQNRAPA